MKLTVRFGKYAAVGTAGTALQLGVLALLDRCAPGHYLWASVGALEAALLHNFAWHSRYTWRDRRNAKLRMRRLARFHLTTGWCP
ncbi:MAG TPA: GtrA family protein [Bryobacteraceae bacterium]|nr:GtrA family protein [Bryobacteraceae bacterium]